MARDTEKRRAELRDTLIDIAEDEIRRNGLGALRARNVAERAGCSVGAIYNVFDDMPKLVLAANMRTFARLGAHISQTVEGRGDEPPVERLVLMAEAYVDFARDNLNLWRALFDVEMTADSDVPEWYLDELARLFGTISAPIAELSPGLGPGEADLWTRTMFSAVHGVMLLSLERRMSGVPLDRMKPMICKLIRSAARAV